MPREVKILIPDFNTDDSVDINVVSDGKQVVNYRLKIFSYPDGKTQQSRAMFAKEKIENYDKDFDVFEVGLESNNQIPILFRKKKMD